MQMDVNMYIMELLIGIFMYTLQLDISIAITVFIPIEAWSLIEAWGTCSFLYFCLLPSEINENALSSIVFFNSFLTKTLY